MPVTEVVEELGDRLVEICEQNDKVLWLVSGGSNVGFQAQIRQKLSAYLDILTVLPADERYGAYDHPDSNAAQLRAAGFGEELTDVLQAATSFADAVDLMTTTLRTEVKRADYVFATLGMGADGHIVGALPGSVAVAAIDAAAGYQGPDFARLTVSLPFLQRCDEIAVLVYGPAKAEALERLRENRESSIDLPAQSLYASGNVTIYNEIYGG